MTRWAEDYLKLCARAHSIRVAIKSMSGAVNWTIPKEEMQELLERRDELQHELLDVEAAMKQMRYNAREYKA